MQPVDDPEIDWTGVQPSRSRIAPLDGDTFLQRVRLLSERAASLTALREAFAEHRPDDVAELEAIRTRRDS